MDGSKGDSSKLEGKKDGDLPPPLPPSDSSSTGDQPPPLPQQHQNNANGRRDEGKRGRGRRGRGRGGRGRGRGRRDNQPQYQPVPQGDPLGYQQYASGPPGQYPPPPMMPHGRGQLPPSPLYFYQHQQPPPQMPLMFQPPPPMPHPVSNSRQYAPNPTSQRGRPHRGFSPYGRGGGGERRGGKARVDLRDSKNPPAMNKHEQQQQRLRQQHAQRSQRNYGKRGSNFVKELPAEYKGPMSTAGASPMPMPNAAPRNSNDYLTRDAPPGTPMPSPRIFGRDDFSFGNNNSTSSSSSSNNNSNHRGRKEDESGGPGFNLYGSMDGSQSPLIDRD